MWGYGFNDIELDERVMSIALRTIKGVDKRNDCKETANNALNNLK
jgi:hypothetical protein